MNDRRRPGSGGPRAASPAVAVGVAILAAILGFFILKQFDDKGDTTKPVSAGADDTSISASASTVLDADGNPVPAETQPTPAPTAAPVARSSFNVVVANASKVDKAAAALKTALEREGYVVLPPTNVIDAAVTPPITPPIATTRIMFAVGQEAAAAEVVKVLCGLVPELMTVSPVGPDAASAAVVVVLGTDLAKQPLPCGTAQVQTGGTTAATVPTAPASPNDPTTTVL
jgi:hypothetical protein